MGRPGIAGLLLVLGLLTSPHPAGSADQLPYTPIGTPPRSLSASGDLYAPVAAQSVGPCSPSIQLASLWTPVQDLPLPSQPGERTAHACADTVRAMASHACILTASLGEPGVYRVYFDSQDQLAELAAIHNIWEVNRVSGYALMALPARDVLLMRSQGFRLELEAEQMQSMTLGPPGHGCYRDVAGLEARLQEFASAHPGLTELVDYGDSWRKVQGLAGHDLWALKITNAAVEQEKPRFLLMANIHGRELVTPETALYFAEHLLENYGQDPDVTWIVDYHEVFVILTANPDARQVVEDGCYQRKNLNNSTGQCIVCDQWGSNHYGVDLNRNNPYRWGGASTDPCRETYQGPQPASEPETYHLNTLVRSIFANQRPDDDVSPAAKDTSGLLISLHSYGDLVLWPWGWTYSTAPNSGQLQTLGRKFAFFNDYVPKQASLLYPTTGDTTDWAYGELGIPAFTYELGDTFFQPCEDLQQIQEENLGALLYAAKVPRSPYATPSGPDVLELSVLPSEVAAGSPVRISGVIDDTRFNHAHGPEPVEHIAMAAYYVDAPPWITTTTPFSQPMTATDGTFDETVEPVEARFDTTGLSGGRHTIYVQGRDAMGHWGALSAVFLHIADSRAYLPLVTRVR